MFRALWLVLVEGICWFEGDEMSVVVVEGKRGG